MSSEEQGYDRDAFWSLNIEQALVWNSKSEEDVLTGGSLSCLVAEEAQARGEQSSSHLIIYQDVNQRLRSYVLGQSHTAHVLNGL